MRVFTQRFAVALLIAGAFTAKAHANDHFYDALALAIEHTNANHAKDVKAWGPEHELMYNALQAVEREIPAVKGISRLGSAGIGYGANPFTTLSRELYISKFSGASAEFEERLLAQRLEAQVTELGEGCPFERTTTVKETEMGHTKPSVDTTIETTYRLESTPAKKCKNALTAQLVENGINFVTFIKRETSYSDHFEVRFGQQSNRDMAFVKNQLLKIESLRGLVSELEVGDLSGNGIGKSTSIALVGSSGAASLTESFRLEYWKGWGDCPAGCISGHTWLVEVTPLAGGAFKVELVEESGSPLPGEGELF